MKRDEINMSLREVFSIVLNIPADSIKPDLSPDNCSNWDSLRHVHLVTAISDAFRIHLSIEQQLELMSFQSAVDIVAKAMRHNG